MLTNYDAWLNRAYQEKAERDRQFEKLIETIKEEDLHDDPESLDYYQARDIVDEYFFDQQI